MEKVASKRSSKVRLCLQDIADPHNISACLRSSEAFGLVDIDIVNLHQEYKPSKASRGVHHWLNIHKVESNLPDHIQSLRSQNYKIAAGFPVAQADMTLEEIPSDQKICVVFGNEHSGIDDSWNEHVDYKFTIPTVGFVESLNISVSCAITLHSLTSRMLHTNSPDYYLNPLQQEELLDCWLTRHFGEEKIKKMLAHPSPQLTENQGIIN